MNAVPYDHSADQNTRFDWFVRVYDEDDKIIASWTIEDRTEREAEKEATPEVDQVSGYEDWTITPTKRY